MSNRPPMTGVRWDRDLGEWQFRCGECARQRRNCYWPLTFEFWSPSQGMTRCRACWAVRERTRSRAYYAAHRKQVRARVAAYDAEVRDRRRRSWQATKERIAADPEFAAFYRDRQHRHAAAYRARLREKAA